MDLDWQRGGPCGHGGNHEKPVIEGLLKTSHEKSRDLGSARCLPAADSMLLCFLVPGAAIVRSPGVQAPNGSNMFFPSHRLRVQCGGARSANV
jgi:hypothetical protein